MTLKVRHGLVKTHEAEDGADLDRELPELGADEDGSSAKHFVSL